MSGKLEGVTVGMPHHYFQMRTVTLQQAEGDEGEDPDEQHSAFAETPAGMHTKMWI